MQRTEKYFESDAFRKTAAGVILAAEADAKTGGGRIALDGTVFYPEGGGQPADRGTLTLADGTVLHVTDVHETNGIIWHTVDALPETLACCGESSLVLFADCQDARRALESGVAIRALNIGNLHYAPGKIQLFPHVALSPQDRDDLRAMLQQQVELDFRCVPSDKIRDAYEELL